MASLFCNHKIWILSNKTQYIEEKQLKGVLCQENLEEKCVSAYMKIEINGGVMDTLPQNEFREKPYLFMLNQWRRSVDK